MAADREGPNGPPYVLIKRGLYWRPDAQGYTGLLSGAGHYTKEDADGWADHDAGSTTTMLVSEAPEFAPACWPETKLAVLTKQRSDAEARAERMEAERDEARAYGQAASAALAGQTPGDSRFYESGRDDKRADVTACLDWIKSGRVVRNIKIEQLTLEKVDLETEVARRSAEVEAKNHALVGARAMAQECAQAAHWANAEADRQHRRASNAEERLLLTAGLIVSLCDSVLGNAYLGKEAEEELASDLKRVFARTADKAEPEGVAHG